MAKLSSILKEARRRQLAEKGQYPKVRLHNRCSICGRPKAYNRLFGLCRLHLREFSSQGLLPGVTKSSW